MDIDGEGCSGASFPSGMPQINLFREIHSNSFSRSISSISSNPAFIQRLELQKKLEGHNGCVNTCAFTPDGQHLLSGSDDRLIKLWDWQQGKQLFSWESGHWSNVFQAKVLTENQHSSSTNPSANLTVVSAAADGQIRIAHISEGRVAHRRVGEHAGRAHKVALIPDTPWEFLSCGEDGIVIHYDLRLPEPALPLMALAHPYMKSRALELYSVACNPVNPNEFCIGGQDEAVRCFDLRKASSAGAGGATVRRALPLAFFSPRCLLEHEEVFSAHVTSAVYSCRGEILVSYNDENIYLIAAKVASGIVAEGVEKHSGSGGGGNDTRMSSPPPTRGTRRGNTRSAGRRRGESNHPSGNGSNRGRGGRGQRRTGRGRVGERGGGGRRAAQQQQQEEADIQWRNRNQRPEELDTTVLRMRYFKANDDQDNNKNENNKNEQEDISNMPPDSFLAKLCAERGVENNAREDLDTSSNSDSDGSGSNSDSDSGNHPHFQPESDDSDDIGNFIVRMMRDYRPPARDSEVPEGSSDDDIDEEGDSEEGNSDSEEESDESESDDDGVDGEDAFASRWPVPRLYSWYNTATHSAPVLDSLEKVSTDRRGGVLQMYQGHRNQQTIKGVSFFGLNDEWVISGSDDGYMYIWNAQTGKAVFTLQGDSHVVNCLERHPHDIFTLATSGIDDDVKIWGCSAVERVDGLSVKDKKRMADNIHGQQNQISLAFLGESDSESESEDEEDYFQ